MLIASSRIIVGATKSQAIERSDRPRMVRPTLGGVALASPGSCGISGCLVRRCRRGSLLKKLELAFFLEDRSPVLDQAVQCFLGCALVGHDIVMHALLHGLEERGVGRLLPEVLHVG